MKKFWLSFIVTMIFTQAVTAQLQSNILNLDSLIEKLDVQHDDMRDITWYHDGKVPNHWVGYVEVYFGRTKSDAPWLRCAIQHIGSDWLFIEKYIIKTDSNTYSVPVVSQFMNRDVSGGTIKEEYDFLVTQSVYRMLCDMSTAQNVKLRCEGKTYYNDRELKKKEKEGIRNVLAAFIAMGGVVE